MGVLLQRNRCAYSLALGDALEKQAQAFDIGLSYVPVDWSADDTNDDGVEIENALAKLEQQQGLVLMSAVFPHGLKRLAKFAQRWWPRPSISMGYRLPSIPSVLVDNRGAMKAATRHLIVEHGRREILFLRGRRDSQESTDRYLGYREALREHGIIHSEDRVLQGTFTRASAVTALAHLPADIRFDGFIAANDEMALAALPELDRRGFTVPGKISLVGFDDVPAAARAKVPLTTMAQPFARLAEVALGLVMDQHQGRSVRGGKVVPATLVVRRSCGCGG